MPTVEELIDFLEGLPKGTRLFVADAAAPGGFMPLALHLVGLDGDERPSAGQIDATGDRGMGLIAYPDNEQNSIIPDALAIYRDSEADRVEERICARCGCTDAHGCEDGCWWVPNGFGLDLCSSCSSATPGVPDPYRTLDDL